MGNDAPRHDILGELLGTAATTASPEAEKLERLLSSLAAGARTGPRDARIDRRRADTPDLTGRADRPTAPDASDPASRPTAQAGAGASRDNAAEAPGPSRRSGTGSKKRKKTTHYLGGEIHAELCRAREALHDMAPDKLKGRISRSRLVETALKLLLDDFEAKGEDSLLARRVLGIET